MEAKRAAYRVAIVEDSSRRGIYGATETMKCVKHVLQLEEGCGDVNEFITRISGLFCVCFLFESGMAPTVHQDLDASQCR